MNPKKNKYYSKIIKSIQNALKIRKFISVFLDEFYIGFVLILLFPNQSLFSLIGSIIVKGKLHRNIHKLDSMSIPLSKRHWYVISE